MTKIVIFKKTVNRLFQYIVLIGLTTCISVLIILFINPSINDPILYPILVLLLSCIVFLTYLIVSRYRFNKKYVSYYRLIANLEITRDSIKIPRVENLEKTIITLYKVVKGRRKNIDFKYRVIKRGLREILLIKPIEEQLWIMKYSGDGLIEEFFYQGPAYIVRYNGIGFILIVLYPSTIDFEKTLLKVRHGRDYGEISLSIENDSLHVKALYVKHESIDMKLLFENDLVENIHQDIELCVFEQSGEHICRIPLNTLVKPHIIVFPMDKKFIELTRLNIGDFEVRGPLNRNVLIMGYGGLKLKLILNIFDREEQRRKKVSNHIVVNTRYV